MDANAIANLLREVAVLHAESLRSTPDWDNCRKRISHPDLLNVLQSVTDGLSFRDALLVYVGSPAGVLGKLFFGPMASAMQIDASSNTVEASDNKHRLRVAFSVSGAKVETRSPSGAPAAGNRPIATVTVCTDWTHFHFTHSTEVKHSVDPFFEVNVDELAADIALVGSVWASVFPAHRAILTRTVAISVPRGEEGILFDDSREASPTSPRHGASPELRRELRTLDRLKSTFSDGSGLQLLSHEELRQRFTASGDLVKPLSERRVDEFVVRTYRPPRSSIVCFDPSSPVYEPKRGDYILSYQPFESTSEFDREFVMTVGEWKSEEQDLYRATLDILHVLAIRRSGLFRLGFAQRVYTVLLPPALVEFRGADNWGMFLVPCIVLYQVPRRSSFRRTFTVSYVAVPVDFAVAEDKGGSHSPWSRIKGPRIAGIDELRALRRALKAHVVSDQNQTDLPDGTVHGPLARLLHAEGDCLALPVILQKIGEFISGRVIARGRPSALSLAPGMTFTATVESALSTLLLQVDWCSQPGSAQPWENWLITEKDKSFTDNVYKLMFYEDFVEPRSGYTSRRGIDFARMLVGNSLRTDMNGMSFFDPTDEFKLILYPLHREQYPNYSIVRWMAFSLYSESALSALQGMIQRFYIDLHRQDDLRQVVETLGEMTESFAELYDLDIRRYLYRQEYERLRELLKVDRDYKFLLDKFGSVKEDASLREQRLFNKLLVAFTIATTSVAIIGTIAQVQQWSLGRILGVTVPIAIVLTAIGYAMFDPMRRLFSRGR